MTEELWFDFLHVQDICSKDALLPTKTPVEWVSWEISPGVIWMGMNLTTGVFKNVWSNTSILPYLCRARCLIKHLVITPTVRLYARVVIKYKVLLFKALFYCSN